jgi:hypothetical protein
LKIHFNIILPSTPGSPKWSSGRRQNVYIAYSVHEHYSNTILVQPIYCIQCLYITTVTLFLYLGPTCLDPVVSSLGTRSELKIKHFLFYNINCKSCVII